MCSSFKTFWHLQGVHQAESVAYLSRSKGRADNAGSQLFDNLAKLNRENKMNWYKGFPRALQTYHDLPGPTGLSPHVAVFSSILTSTQHPWHEPGMALNAEEFVAKQKKLHRLISDSHPREHTAVDDRRDYTEPGPVYKNRDAF